MLDKNPPEISTVPPLLTIDAEKSPFGREAPLFQDIELRDKISTESITEWVDLKPPAMMTLFELPTRPQKACVMLFKVNHSR